MYDLLSWDKDGKVNSSFGYRPSSATNGVGSTNHKGIDLSSNNDNVPSVLGGKVIANAWNNARGWYITIQNNDGYTSTYQHLASKSPLAVGSSVKEGQTIGTQGSTGNSTGKHLHFEVKDSSGKYIDPMQYLAGATGTGSSDSVLTDAHGRPVSNAAGTDGADNVGSGTLTSIVWDLVSKIVTFLAVLLIAVLAVILFMKAFDIQVF